MAYFDAPAIYAEQLSKLYKGLPLWFPEPEGRNIKTGMGGGEIRIGDVGLVVRGRFNRLFNVLQRDNEDEDNIEGPPEGAESLAYDPRIHKFDAAALQPGLFGNGINSSIQVGMHANVGPVIIPAGVGGEYQFVTNSAQGAMLLLPDTVDEEYVMPNRDFTGYMTRQYEAWHRFAAGQLKLECKPEELMLVRGTSKTTNWTVAAFQQESRAVKAGLSGSFAAVPGVPVVSAGFNLAMSHAAACKKESRSRPFVADIIPGKRDQSVFLQVYKIKPRHIFKFLPPRIVAGAGPHELPRHEDYDDGPAGADAQIISEPGESVFRYEPVDTLLDYILENYPEVEAAIACEGEIVEMLGGDPIPENLAEYLVARHPQIYVDPETRVGMVSLVWQVQESRTRTIKRNSQQQTPQGGPMDVGDGDGQGDVPRGVDPLASGELTLGRTPGSRPIKWPHVALMEESAEGSAVSSMALSPDGSHIATGMEDSVIRLWDYKHGSLWKKLAGHDDTPWSLSFAPDGNRLVSGSGDNTAMIWRIDVDEEENPILFTLQGHTSDVWSVAFSPNGKFVATGSTDSSVRVWDAETGDQIHSFHMEGSNVMQILWTPDNTRIVSCADMGGRCWNVVEGREIVTFRGHQGAIWCMNITKEGDRLITGSEDHTVRIWNMETGEELVTISEHAGAVWSVAFSPNGENIVSGGYDNKVVVANSFTGEPRYIWEGESADDEIIIDTVAFSRAGDLVASGAADGNVRLYDNRTGHFVAQYSAHTDKVKSVQFGRDDQDLISSSDDGSVRVFNLVDTLRL